MKSIILRKVPEDLHRAFKSKCAADGFSIQAKLIELIRLYIAEPSKAKK